MRGLGSVLAAIGRLAVPYFKTRDTGTVSLGFLGTFRAPERWIAFAMLGTILLINVGQVYMTVLLNQWNNRFFTAMQGRDGDAFWAELGYFCVIAFIFIVTAVYELYISQWLRIRWRTWMTARSLEAWMADGTHYRMRLAGDAADNPDQRIADDVKMFVDQTLGLGVRLFTATLSLAAFVQILWALSSQFPYRVGDFNFASIPGYLVWAALLYAVMGTWLTHLIGRPLIMLNFNQQRYEADFRFSLVRLRENAEQVALMRGEAAERGVLMQRFRDVITNWHLIMSRQKKLTWFTAFYGQISDVFPYVILAATYFTTPGMPLGAMTQTAGAFGRVQTAFSLFIDLYTSLAEYKAVIDRLTGFRSAIGAAEARRDAGPRTASVAGTTAFAADGITVALPDGTPLVASGRLAVAPGESVLVTGPSGAGKSTILRALAGIWPYGEGEVALPEGKHALVLPQRPYLPLGSLKTAVTYPAAPDSVPDEVAAEALRAVGLHKIAGRLADIGNWATELSLGEQQRLAVARALLQAPDFLFLDEATASLDEPAEAALYALIRARLPQAGIVSIGHRSTLAAFHDRQVVLEPAPAGGSMLVDRGAIMAPDPA